MRLRKLLFLPLFATLCGAADDGRIDIKIIANPNVKVSEVSRDDLSRIFLMTKSSLTGAAHVEPVLDKGPAYEVFLKAYIGRSDSALMTYYRSLVFTGRASIPRSFASDSEVAAYVARTKGAIGYVSSEAVTTGVKTLEVK
jgi:ABC-type phosphate transport system substrate-binding protein